MLSSTTTMPSWRCTAAALFSTPSTPLLSSPQHTLTLHSSPKNHRSTSISTTLTPLIISHSSNSTTFSWSETEEQEASEYEAYTEEYEEEDGGNSFASGAARTGHAPPPLRRRRRRYRKQYPGEKKGITEEMRFVAMKLRNSGKPKKAKRRKEADNNKSEDNDDGDEVAASENGSIGEEQNGESWEPSIEGFLKYLVDSKLVFTTIERIVDESTDVSYVYLRKTGLERAECLSKDLEWFSQQGNSIPKTSNPGVTYAKYLEELAEKSPPLFMSHFYNIYFSHIAGGQVIAKKVSQKLLQGRELEFFKWEGNEEELLRGTRDKINMLGEHWTRDEKNKCLKEATKAFSFLGQIVRLIIL